MNTYLNMLKKWENGKRGEGGIAVICNFNAVIFVVET